MTDKLSRDCATGTVEGTGSLINIMCGFKPKVVQLFNADGSVFLTWNDLMADDSGYKILGSASGTNAASAAPLNLATPAFSGTGFATAGQVVTTTDNQTMTLNQCAGMWLIANGLASTPPALIVSNTAVTGAPAVLTVIGAAPVTDAGTYKVVQGLAAAQTFTPGAGTAAAIVADGIIPTFNGFSIGADADANVSAETIYWSAFK